ncbi:MAG: bifunctional precorrin-2 dehydrogenase/sirohydrochlorin ferrochelatase [Phycisphaeraceae bacterium]
MMVSLTGRRVVIVGGGKVARRRARAMLDAGADVCVIAPEMDAAFSELPVSRIERGYAVGDLENAFLVVVATDDTAINDAVSREARRLEILINRTDQPELGDVTIPAHAHRGPLTVSVHTGGISASAAADIRDQLIESVDPDMIRLLQNVAPFRQLFKQRICDAGARRRALRAITEPAALAVLKAEGEEALQRHCQAILSDALRQVKT